MQPTSLPVMRFTVSSRQSLEADSLETSHVSLTSGACPKQQWLHHSEQALWLAPCNTAKSSCKVQCVHPWQKCNTKTNFSEQSDWMSTSTQSAPTNKTTLGCQATDGEPKRPNHVHKNACWKQPSFLTASQLKPATGGKHQQHAWPSW